MDAGSDEIYDLFYGQDVSEDSSSEGGSAAKGDGLSEISKAAGDIVERILPSGAKEYRLHGDLHREDGPALIGADGSEEWYQHGLLHREGGPAATDSKGKESWYLHGSLHRIGGPAISYPGGESHWYQGGMLHREDGPAKIYIDDLGAYRREWYLYGERHREDGPAVVTSGAERWYRDGKLHRVGGPALTSASDETAWLENGEYHRTDGPAIVGRNPGRHLVKEKRRTSRSKREETYKTYAVRGALYPDTWRGRRAWRRASQKDSRRSSREVQP